MKKFFLLLLTCFAAFAASTAVAADSDWKVYASYHNATKSVELGNRVYVLANGDLYSYGTDDQSIETYDKAGELNDFGIYDIQACGSTNEIVVVYKNGNVDLLSAGGDVFNISDLKTKSLVDKTLNDVVLEGTTLYISTNSGLAILDVKNRLFNNIYSLGYQVKAVCENDGYVVASTSNGVYRGKRSINLLDPKNWEKISDVAAFKKFLKIGNSVFAQALEMYKIDNMSDMSKTQITADRVSNSFVCNGKVFFTTTDNKLKSVDEAGAVQTYTAPFAVSHLLYKSNNYWASCGETGFMALGLNGSSFTQTVGDVTPNSPVRNYSYRLNMIDRRLLVAGGNFYYPEVEYTGTAMKYEDGKWTAFDEKAAIDLVGANTYHNVTDVVQDPNDSEHHWLGTKRSGIYEFKDYKLTRHFSYDNSPLTTILPNSSNPQNYVRVTGLNYDSQRNLWMCNNQCDTIVRILKNDGKWIAYYYEEIKGFPTFDYVMFDKREWAWINSRRLTEISAGGLLIVNTNGTINTQKDDTHKFVKSITNQDNQTYEIDVCYCMEEDMDGAIWIGLSNGLFVANKPENIFSSDYKFTQIKVARNDGTGLADYLLNGVRVTCIAVDGANRKWIGSGGSGVYLISADGQEELLHFTKNDSPLISDNVNDIEIDGATGEVFFATDAGLCSYLGDAVDAEGTLNENNIKVYPNPIRPESRQLVRVTGLSYNTNVQIANAAGRLVYEGTSNGGEFTWNCRTSSGKPVASGVYYILATDSDGKKGATAKVLVIR